MCNKILVLQGCPATGKSYFAKEFLTSHSNYIRTNRDDIRRMLGEYWMPQREELVSDIEESIVNLALKHKYNVIIDDTNLNPKVISLWNYVASKNNAEIEFKRFTVPLEKALQRDKDREFPVGEAVIRNFYKKYENI